MKRRKHILVVTGDGGHSKECLRLVELLGSADYHYSYVVVNYDNVTERKIQVRGPVYRLPGLGGKRSNALTDLAKYPFCAVLAAAVLLRSRPDAVVTTGPGVAVPVCLLARFFGVLILFVETGSRVRALSATGKLMRCVAHVYFVQWEELLPVAPGAIYAGRLF